MREGFYDEMVDATGMPREHARTLVDALDALGPEALAAAGRRRDAIFMQQGITFDAAGPDHDGPTRDRPFPLDLVPRIIPADEWRTIKRGLAQRIRALNHFIDDVYHGREIVHEGLVPWELIVSRPGSRAPRTASGRPAACTATSPAATSCATATAPGRCSRTTCARRAASRTCSRTGSR